MQPVWFLLALAAAVSLQAREIVFEKFDQLSGTDLYGSTLRVRKYNRTMMVINGTLAVKKNLNNSIVISTDLFHSSRGNQQFNHYPGRLPTKGVCEFLEDFYEEYNGFLEGLVNIPPKGSCPIVPREVYILNKVFPVLAIHSYMPLGLWKMLLINRLNSVEVARFEIIFKIKSDLFS